MSNTILDSGNRTVFYDENGNALGQRDIQEEKGACELMPLDVVAEMMPNAESKYILRHIERFKETGDHEYLFGAIKTFIELRGWSVDECIFEVSLHYKQGKEKYGAYNWQKGIPVSSFLSSGIRHVIKFALGWDDEPHDRAFVWNMMGAIWTMNHKPEMIDIPFDLLGGK
jgi:hypothetical protein